ncbi:MAG: 3-deoxy-7-phosphoheptulonate synthase [Lachnospiraceae bacterium]|nr:3-deoxy-7-phosphoheptulonate synthase [Lachnospiraceae bacterium]
MIIIMKPGAARDSVQAVVKYIEENGLKTHLSEGTTTTIIGVVGDKTRLTECGINALKDVDRIVPVTESYKLVNRKFHPDATTVRVGNTSIGPDTLTVIAGPCAVENEEMLVNIARHVKSCGATMLRGGAYKPRTSPYSFQGLEEEGLKYMQAAGKETGLATVSEVVDLTSLEAAVKYVDMLQIGARNMQNFCLLKEVGRVKTPVLLKRGLSATIDEWLNAAEYIISEGNPNVVLCERGIRTYETATRNTLDISAVPVLKEKTHLPIIVDPSHSTGHYKYVTPVSKAAVACGCDGLEIEVHHDPARAMSDGPQSLTFEKFDELCRSLRPLAELENKKF